MGEELAETLLKASDVMHWLEKYQLANALILLSRLVRANKIGTLDDLQRAVTEAENRN